MKDVKKAVNVCASLATSNINNKEEVRIYPNPANLFVYVDFGSIKPKNVSYKIIDYSGRTIITSKNNQLDKKLEIDVSTLKIGNYLLQILTESQEYDNKLIIAR